MTDKEKLEFARITYPVGTRVIVSHMYYTAMGSRNKKEYSIVINKDDNIIVSPKGTVLSDTDVPSSWMRVLYWHSWDKWAPILLDDNIVLEVDPYIPVIKSASIDALFEQKLKQTLL